MSLLPRVAARSAPYFCFWIVWYGALLHLYWAMLLVFSSNPEGSTPVAGIVRGLGQSGLDHRGWLIAALTISSLAALSVTAMTHRSLWTVALLIPQQSLFIMSSWSSFRAMTDGMYADGIVRPFGFISADQAPSVLAAIVYTVAIFTFHTWRSGYTWRK